MIVEAGSEGDCYVRLTPSPPRPRAAAIRSDPLDGQAEPPSTLGIVNDDHDWRYPGLRVNILLRDTVHLLGDPDARPILKIEVNNAIKMREKLKRGVWWNVILAMLLACSTGCALKPKCQNGPGDVPGNCLPWPPQAPLVNYNSI